MPRHPTQSMTEFLAGAEHLNRAYRGHDSLSLTRSGNPLDDDAENGHSDEGHDREDDPR